ncbi:uncharacterized protein LOC115804989 [Chanos chanos]|uniref:Uncharacterized protein LOC115804989 n=1 Tax=Chanos chanos TaxID=29144 RepID=A0A6J2UQH0_CHACN|nr:uncharacterized protein LOC115804989 [Chanos chanos]
MPRPSEHKREHAADHYGHHHSFFKASSSSLTSSASSYSSSMWASEPSLDDETYLTHGTKPQHSLSCSNIPEARPKYRDEESEDMEFNTRDPVFFQSQTPHQKKSQNPVHLQQHLPSSPRGPGFPKLHRGHSKSEEGLLQSTGSARSSGGGGRTHQIDHGPLYKTASLGQSLAFDDETERTVRGMGKPKKAASSTQLPTKGILKNKDGGTAAVQKGNFRKAKSMEVLSTRVQVTAPKQGALDAAKENFVRGKLEFSAFLDEITRQVISPSRLSSLGVSPTSTPTSTSPKLPHEERKQPLKMAKQGKEDVPSAKQQHTKIKNQDSEKTSTDSSSHSRSQRRCHSGKHNHTHHPSNPSCHHPPSDHPGHAKQPSTTERQGSTVNKQHHRKYSQLLTDGTSTSPEPLLQEQKQHHVKHKEGHRGSVGSSRHLHTGLEHKSSQLSMKTTSLESESHSSKSSASPSSEKSSEKRHKSSGHRRHSKTHRDSVCSIDRALLLEQYNKELHEKLLQTVACIENMEADLQTNRAELASYKEKFKKLQENYASSQQANGVLEQKIQSIAENMNSERKYLLQRILELTKQLDSAQITITSLKNLNVPCLIKELLEKHFNSQEALRGFLLSSATPCQSMDSNQLESRNNQSPSGKLDEKLSNWPDSGERGSEVRHQRVTAFLPWIQGQEKCAAPDQDGFTGNTQRDQQLDAKGPPFTDSGITRLPFSVADIGLALHNKTDDDQAIGHDPMATKHHLGLHTEVHSFSLGTQRGTDVPLNPYNLEKTGSNKGTGASAVNLESNANDVMYLNAQRMLDNILSQIQPPAPKQREEDSGHEVEGWTSRPAKGL